MVRFKAAFHSGTNAAGGPDAGLSRWTGAAVWLAAVVLLCAHRLDARDIYVDNLAGDDSFSGFQSQPGSDLGGPVRTIARALQLAQPGDRIILAANEEPYRESITLSGSRHSGYADHPFVIQGNGAILDGSAPVPKDAWQRYRGPVFRFQPPGKAYQQLFLGGRPASRVPVGLPREGPPPLEPLQWCLAGGYIYFCVPPSKLPDEYDLSYSRLRTGITLYHVRHVAIVDLTVQGFQVDGIQAANSARDVYLAGLTCRGNGRSGIAVGGACEVEIDVSLLGNNGEAQLLTLPWSDTHVRNSHLLGNTAPGWVDRGGRVDVDGRPVSGGMDEIHPPQFPGDDASAGGAEG